MKEVVVPDIGDYKDVPVIEVLVKPGDSIKAEDSLVTLESDKATMEVPSPFAGVVRELKVKIGDENGTGALVAMIEASAAAAAPAAKPAAPAAPTAPPPPAAAPPSPPSPPKSAAPAAAAAAHAPAEDLGNL